MKLKAPPAPPKARLSATISGEVNSDLELYIELLGEDGYEPTFSSVVEAMLEDFMKNDKEFQSLKRNRKSQ